MGTTIEVGRLLLKDTWDISSISKEEKTDKYCIVKKKKKKKQHWASYRFQVLDEV